MIPMIKTYGAATRSDLGRLEKRLGVSLPQGYTDFLLTQNGGHPDLPEFIIGKWGGSIVNVFYGLGIGGPYDLEAAIESFVDVMPIDLMIPVGEDPGGNQICLGVKGDNLGKIYFWVHDEMDENEVRSLYEVCSSFEEFVNQAGH